AVVGHRQQHEVSPLRGLVVSGAADGCRLDSLAELRCRRDGPLLVAAPEHDLVPTSCEPVGQPLALGSGTADDCDYAHMSPVVGWSAGEASRLTPLGTPVVAEEAGVRAPPARSTP